MTITVTVDRALKIIIFLVFVAVVHSPLARHLHVLLSLDKAWMCLTFPTYDWRESKLMSRYGMFEELEWLYFFSFYLLRHLSESI